MFDANGEYIPKMKPEAGSKLADVGATGSSSTGSKARGSKDSSLSEDDGRRSRNTTNNSTMLKTLSGNEINEAAGEPLNISKKDADKLMEALGVTDGERLKNSKFKNEF